MLVQYSRPLNDNEKIVFSDINLNVQTTGVEFVFNEQAIINQLFMVWGTTKGERTYLRNYGCDLIGLLFDPMTNGSTAMKIRYEMREAAAWVPEIQFTSGGLDVIPDQTLPGYVVKFNFTIPKLGPQQFNLDFNLLLPNRQIGE